MTDVKLRTGRFTTLKNLLTTLEALDEDTVTEDVLKTYTDSANSNWQKLEEAHECVLTITDETSLQIQFNAYEPMHAVHIKIQTILNRLQRKVSVQPPPQQTANIKLPDMSLPTFDGKYEGWPTFSDLFTASIDKNSSLSGSHKLQYLKACVKGEAASIIKSFTITDANYIEAWSLLVSQYDNKRKIISSHVKRLLFQPSLLHESASSLQLMLNTTLECIRSLKVLGQETDKWDSLIVVALVEKFDSDTKAEWARSLKGTTPSTFQELKDFIIQHIRTLHAKGSLHHSIAKVSVVNSNTTQRQFNTHHTSVQSSCQHCSGDHQLFQCTHLKDMSPEQRTEAVKSLNLCLNCLRSGHSYKECRSKSRCKTCNKPHNTFLHFPTDTLSNTHQQHDNQQIASSSHISIHNTILTSNSSRLLKTALVDVLDSHNIKRQVRVFIDEGAEGSLIKESTLLQLGLEKKASDVIISGVCGTTASKSRWMTNIRLYSQVNDAQIDLEVHSVPKITNAINQLSHHTKPFNWNHISGLRLADPFFHEDREIDILIGADTAPYIFKPGIKRADRASPVAQDTIFGWVISGNVLTPQLQQQSSLTVNHFKLESSETLNKGKCSVIPTNLETSEPLYKLKSSHTPASENPNCNNIIPSDLQPDWYYRYKHDFFQCFSDVRNCDIVSADLQPARYNYKEYKDTCISSFIPKSFGVIPSLCRWSAYLSSAHLCNDNETNFVDGLIWLYDPFSSPHQSGLWKAGVNCFKHSFYRVVRHEVLYCEEIYDSS